MKWNSSKEANQAALLIALSIITGSCSGAIAGWVSANAVERQTVLNTTNGSQTNQPVGGTSATSTAYATSTEPKLTVVRVDQVPPEAIVPPAFASQESSSVATLYAKPGKTVRVFRNEDMLGQAVAVTSDGWFVVPLEILGTRHMEDVVLWYEGRSLSVTRGVVDHRGSVIFLKVDVKDAKAPSFARFQDITRGLSVWVERRAGSFEPMSITSLFEEAEALAGSSSDVGSRRPTLSGIASKIDTGAPVWAGNGSLVGLVATGADGVARFIPSSDWAPSLYGIFSDGVVKHASLGVSTVNLSAIRLVNPPAGLPERGAWIVADGSKNPVIVPESPAEKAGLKEGDVIAKVDQDILDGRADLGEILIQYKPNASVVLKVIRDGKVMDIPVTLGSKVVSEELK